MLLRVFDFRDVASPQEFAEFWANRYSYPNGNLYDANIGQPLTEARVWDLYKWKNGNPTIAQKKRQSIISAYLPELAQLPALNSLSDGRTYLQTLSGGAIWDIFWLHCIRSAVFPIFDQHTYRAMAAITQIDPREIPDGRTRKIAAYFDQYVPFVQRFGVSDYRTLDKALFAYGRFLKTTFAT